MIDGLRVALDHERGGEIAANLARLYDYIIRRLTEGNLRNDAALLDEAVELLNEIRGGWDAAARQVQLRSAGAPA
jgi:flagellar protein FliS